MYPFRLGAGRLTLSPLLTDILLMLLPPLELKVIVHFAAVLCAFCSQPAYRVMSFAGVYGLEALSVRPDSVYQPVKVYPVLLGVGRTALSPLFTDILLTLLPPLELKYIVHLLYTLGEFCSQQAYRVTSEVGVYRCR